MDSQERNAAPEHSPVSVKEQGMAPEISVIIPVYNRESTIEGSVRSVLDQTVDDIEVLAVDDHSADSSVEILKKITDPRLKVICCETNGGACKARNIGIAHARGKYIAFQDSDDQWHKDRLQRTLEALQKENADLVFCAREVQTVQNGIVTGKKIPDYNLNLREDKLAALLRFNCVSTQTITGKREVFENVQFDLEFPRFQDWDLALQAVLHGFKLYYLDEVLVQCSVQENSLTASCKKAEQAFRLLENKYRKEYMARPKTYGEFCGIAGHILEKEGGSGADYFYKEWKYARRPAGLAKMVLSKLHLLKV